MIRTAQVLALLVATASTAGGRMNTPNVLPSSAQATAAAMTMYLDPTGSDANACAASGTAACLTPNGLLMKLPKAIRHQVTVDMADGTYPGVTVSGFTLDQSFQKTTQAGIFFKGRRATSTGLAGGTATGTATAVSAGSGITWGTLTDGTQTWTVNDLRGRFVFISSGTGLNTVARIVANTGTVITIAGIWSANGTAPTSGSGYTIQDVSVFITPEAVAVPGLTGYLAPTPNGPGSGTAAAGIQILSTNGMGMRVAFQDIAVTAATTGLQMAGPVEVDFNNVKFSGNLTIKQGSRAIFDRYWVVGGLTCNDAGTSVTVRSGLRQGGMFVATGGNAVITGEQVYAVNGTGGYNPRGNGTMTLNTARVDCLSVASSYGLLVGTTGYATSLQTINGTVVSLAALDVTNCTVGLKVVGQSIVSSTSSTSNTLSGNALLYAYVVDWGGKIWLSGNATPTITSGTAAIAIDQAGATAADFTGVATAGACLPVAAAPTGSRICKL